MLLPAAGSRSGRQEQDPARSKATPSPWCCWDRVPSHAWSRAPDLPSRCGPRGQRCSAGDPPSRSHRRTSYRRSEWLLGEGRFILLWGNRIIYVPSFQRGNLMSFPTALFWWDGGVAGDRVSGLVPVGLTLSGWAANHPWGGSCLLSPNRQGISPGGALLPKRDHPGAP